MNKKKVGAAVGAVILTLIVVFTQLFDFSIFSLSNKKDLVQKVLLENALAEGLSDEVKEKKTITYKQEEKMEYVVASPVKVDMPKHDSEEQSEIKISVEERKIDKKEESEAIVSEEKVEKTFSGYIQTEARLRKDANTECDILDVLEINTFVKGVIEGDWLKITHNDKVGYVKLDLIGLAEVQIPEDVQPDRSEQTDAEDTEEESEKTKPEVEPEVKPEPEIKPEAEIKEENDSDNNHESEYKPEVHEHNKEDSEKDEENNKSDNKDNDKKPNDTENSSGKDESDKQNSESSDSNGGEKPNGNVKPEEEKKPEPEKETEESQAPDKPEESEENQVKHPTGAGSVYEYSIDDFTYSGVINWSGKTFSFYSQNVLPGEGLDIPGRHCEGGYVRDGDGYIVLASDYYPKGTVISTPFGSDGKVYDAFGYGKPPHRFDVYIEYFE